MIHERFGIGPSDHQLPSLPLFHSVLLLAGSIIFAPVAA